MKKYSLQWRDTVLSGTVLLSFILLVCAVFSSYWGFLDGLEVKTLDARFKHRNADYIADKIVLLYITDDCIDRLGRWPWPRKMHADIVSKLAGAGADLIIFDIIFFDEDLDDPQNDVNLVKACADFRKVIFPALIEQVDVYDSKTLEIHSEYEARKPFDSLASVAYSFGFINVDYRSLNPDGIVRRLPLVLRKSDSNDYYKSLSLAAAEAALGKTFNIASDGRLYCDETEIPQVTISNFSFFQKQSDTPFKRAFLVNYLGEAASDKFKAVSYSDLALNNIDVSIFRDKIVLIGPSAVGLSDIKLTPYGEMPGVLIHANALQNLLSKNFLYYITPAANSFLLALLTIVATCILVYLSSWYGLFAIIALFLVYNIIAFVLFTHFSIVIEIVIPNLMIAFQFIGGRFWQMIYRLREAYRALKQRSIELERSNLALDKQVHNLSTLNEVGRKFASNLNIDILAKEILEVFRNLLHADDAVLTMLEPESGALKTLGQIGFSDENIDNLLNDRTTREFIELILKKREPVLDMNGQNFTHYIPLVMGSQVWGSVLLSKGSCDLSVNDNGDFWATLSGLAATALENARLYELATVDALTRLFVRRYFQIQIEREFKRALRYHHALSLIMTDIDKFKSFNDTYGHQQGDLVLRETAAAIKRSLREIDIPTRYGGEEFAIILPETDLQGALIVAERMRCQVETTSIPRINLPNASLRVTISLGVACFPHPRIDAPEKLVKLADEALYRAKENGRNRVESISPE